MLSKINITEAFSKILDLEHPYVVADVNEFQVKFSKLKGEFVWHSHEDEDELFLVVKGQLKMKLRDGEVLVNEGEMICVPHGVEHCPESEEEAHVILFERATTVNTGDAVSDKTRAAGRL
ncbi:cupin domain-containing protein [bacterium]|nr:cupin domain-containing protein [bacterium]MBU1637438.1 cupin domain-containing protein [bacterium]